VRSKRARDSRRPERRSLVDALTEPRCYGHAVDAIRVVETHISWVFLTGRYAYKVKKPLKLSFVDFSTLERRHRFCLEELRLNRRLAPELYLGVVPIGGSPEKPRIGRKPAFEYAVKMREFDGDARLDRRLAADLVPRAAFTSFAERLAEFHRGLAPVRKAAVASAAADSALHNVAELGRQLHSGRKRELATLRTWTERECASLAGVFARRAAAGAHRECHGDLHLENLLSHDGTIIAFDALEFDPKLREIDVISEAAFLAMDLIAHRRPDLAFAFLNRYVEVGGDYAGVDVLRFYLVYRALVRAKVAAIKRAQSGSVESKRDPYLRTALELIKKRRPLLLITHGLSGSGKTHVTDELVCRLPALRVRSDVERKRLHGVAALARTGAAVGRGLYAPKEHERTYATLGSIADRLLRRGENAIVDATFLRRNDRHAFRQIAAANGARFAILDCTASDRELRRRILARGDGGRDASEATLAVLEAQLREREPLDRAERHSTIEIDTESGIPYARIVGKLRGR
jgi:aminoglycoside phosphotransferase family enzyme/predicted kinase